MKHAPTPWVSNGTEIFDAKGRCIAITYQPKDEPFQFYTAQRIVACVNAMDGIEDPAAARVILDEPQTQHARDLIYGLIQAVGQLKANYVSSPLNGEAALIDKLEALIKKAGG